MGDDIGMNRYRPAGRGCVRMGAQVQEHRFLKVILYESRLHQVSGYRDGRACGQIPEAQENRRMNLRVFKELRRGSARKNRPQPMIRSEAEQDSGMIQGNRTVDAPVRKARR